MTMPPQFPPPSNHPSGGYPPAPQGYPTGYAPGGPPQPSDRPAPPHADLGAPAAPAKPPKTTPRQWLNLAVLVAVLGGVAWGCHHFTRSDAEKVEAGQCVAVGGGRTDPKVDITDCAATAANYVVAARLDDSVAKCPQGDYASVWQTGSGGYTLCLQLNVHRGDCIAKSFDNTTKVACGAQATHRVTDILTGTTSDAGCGDEATSYLTYSKPELLVVCLAKAGR